MIIKELTLSNFGKFNNKNVELAPGLNIVYGENEAGKTTIHTFIRGMLFGIDKQRGKASGKDVYSKYEPWENPSNYKGTMVIEKNGKDYRIERSFNTARKAFQVVDIKEGRILGQAEIDKLFEGLDESCYYNTISISQLGSVTDKELEGILKNYAANLGSTKSMEIDIKEACIDLDSQKKKIMSENRIGDEDIIRKSIGNQKELLEMSEREQHTIIASIEQKKSVLAGIVDEKKDLSARDAKRLEELAKQNERKETLYQDAITYTAEVEKYSGALQKIKQHKAMLKEQLALRGIDDKNTMEYLTEKVLNKGNAPISFILLIIACIGIAAGYIVGNYQMIELQQYWIKPAICLGAAGVFFICAIIKYIFNKKSKKKKLMNIKELRLISDKLEAATHEEVYTQRQLASKQDALDDVQRMIRAEEEKETENFDYSEQIQDIEEQERNVNDEISKAQWVLEQKKEIDIQTEKKIEELSEELEEIQKAKIEIEALEDAKMVIEEISNEIRNSFGKRLNEVASYYISNITNGKYDDLAIDEKLNISVNSKRSLINVSKLSKGTIEQIYMALRLGAADIIFENDSKPILLDDAFAMYDNKRMGNTMKFMAEKMEQTIIFSCHTREKVMADKLGLNYNFIRL